MAGIERIVITDRLRGRGAWRFKKARERWPMNNAIYRAVFESIGMPLASGYTERCCTAVEAAADLDRQRGIDVISTAENGTSASLQEKTLFTDFVTLTIEHMNNPEEGEEGDWFNCQAQYSFIGNSKPGQDLHYWDWGFYDLPAIFRETARGNIEWWENRNQEDGAQATFRATWRSDIPAECVIATHLDIGIDVIKGVICRDIRSLEPSVGEVLALAETVQSGIRSWDGLEGVLGQLECGTAAYVLFWLEQPPPAL